MLDRFKAIFARRQTDPKIDDRRGSNWHWFGRSDAGAVVTEDTALNVAAVWACVTLISRSVGMLPWQVYAPRSSEAGDGNQRMADHPVERLLHREPNPEMTPISWREAMLINAALQGNSFAEIERNGYGQPVALWPIRPDRVDMRRDTDTGEFFYAIDGGRTELDAADMFHLTGPTIDGTTGLSVIAYARQSIGLGLAQDGFASSFLRNGAAPSGILKVPAGITTPGMKRLRAEVEQLHGGYRKVGKLAIVDGGTEWVQLGMPPVDAEFLAQRRFSVEEIARFFGVPPVKLGDLTKATMTNHESQNLAFLTDCLLPWIVRLEQEANRKLLTPTGRASLMPFSKINAAAIVRADMDRRNRSYALGRQWGWFSVNDIRRLEDMEPIGPEGDEYLRPMNMTPVGEDAPAEDIALAEATRASLR